MCEGTDGGGGSRSYFILNYLAKSYFILKFLPSYLTNMVIKVFRSNYIYLSTDYFGTRQIIFGNNMNTIEMH